MKTKNYLSIIGILFFSFLFVSCSKEDEGDTIKPVIDLLEPEEGAILRIGSSHGVHFEMNLHDNEAIASYKINIHNNFDGHSHTRASEAGITKPFTFERTYTDKAGQKDAYVHNHDIKIPADATPGNYHLMVYCLDQSGNETYVVRNIVLSVEGGEEGEYHHDEHHHD